MLDILDGLISLAGSVISLITAIILYKLTKH